MGSSGLEPPTSRLSGARSNLLSYEPAARCRCQTRTFFGLVLKFSPGPLLLACLGFTNVASPSAFWILCVLPYFASVLVRSRRSVFPFHLRDGDDGIRTHDPLLAGQVLSQLSYTPMSVTHRPLTLFFCFYNEQGMNLVHNRLPLENSSSMRDFQVLAGFLSIPASRHASTTHSKLNNNIPKLLCFLMTPI